MPPSPAQLSEPPKARASLPMYNLPELRQANAAFWAALRTELKRQGLSEERLPNALEFDRPPVPGQIEDNVLFTQVCGYPLQTIYRGQATILAAPVYRVEHCDGPSHAGVFIVHRESSFKRLEDLRGCRFVFNSRHSNSGMNLPRRALAAIAGGKAFFASVVETHSQPGNIERIARGEADATAVDCVTYSFFRRHRPTLAERTRILAATPRSPSIPFVTSSATEAPITARLREALFRVGNAPEWTSVRDALMLGGIVPIDEGAYAVQVKYEHEAQALGYAQLI